MQKDGPPSFSQKSDAPVRSGENQNIQESHAISSLLVGIKGKIVQKLAPITYGQLPLPPVSQTSQPSFNQQSLPQSKIPESQFTSDAVTGLFINESASASAAPLETDQANLKPHVQPNTDTTTREDPSRPVAYADQTKTPSNSTIATLGRLEKLKIPLGLTPADDVQQEDLPSSFGLTGIHEVSDQSVVHQVVQVQIENDSATISHTALPRTNVDAVDESTIGTTGGAASNSSFTDPVAQPELYAFGSARREEKDERKIKTNLGIHNAKPSIVVASLAGISLVVIGAYFLYSSSRIAINPPAQNVTRVDSSQAASIASIPVESTPIAVAVEPALTSVSSPVSAASASNQIQPDQEPVKAQEAQPRPSLTPKVSSKPQDNRPQIKMSKATSHGSDATTDAPSIPSKRNEENPGLKPRIASSTTNLMKSSIEKSVNEVFNERVSVECTNTLTWIVCREAIRISLCKGKWSEQPEPGAGICKGASGR